MVALLESVGALALAAGGLVVGQWFGRLQSRWWVAGFFVPFVLLLLIGSTRRYSQFEFVAPMSWLVSGRTEFALGGLIAAMVLATPVVRLPRASSRRAVYLLMGVVILLTAVWPFAAPAFNRSFLQSLRTQMDPDGVCRQNTSYTCGPAAAVTVLRRLGLPAEEGELATLAHTSTAIGTPPDLLAAALRQRYEREGLTCDYRHFRSIAELPGEGQTLAIIKFGPLLDHYVAVLQVTEAKVVVGDPFRGKQEYTHAEFAEVWRNCGIVLTRTGAGAARK